MSESRNPYCLIPLGTLLVLGALLVAAPSLAELAPNASCALASVAPETTPGYLLAHPVDPTIQPMGNLSISYVNGRKIATEDYLVEGADGSVAQLQINCISSCPDPTQCVVLGCLPDTVRKTCTLCGCDGGDGVECGQCSCTKKAGTVDGTVVETEN